MPAPNHARRERTAIADLLTVLGPDQPTCCDGWRTRDLAAHLVLRDRRPVAALGIVLPPLAGHTARVQSGLAGRPFDDLIGLVRQPPRWSPASHPPLEPVVNTLEMFIHHEDIRRAQPQWQPRQLDPGLAGALWSRAGAMVRLRLRRFPAALVVAAPGHGEVRTGRGGEPVRLHGEPGELTLFLSGRLPVAQVEVTGPEPLADRLRAWRLGL